MKAEQLAAFSEERGAVSSCGAWRNGRKGARRASADLRFAAWFLWMTPLLAALSRLAHAVRMASVASATSPASAASRNLRTAVFSDDLTALLRWCAFSFCLLRLIWDFMFATRKPRSRSLLVRVGRGRQVALAAAPHTSAGRIRSDEAGYLNLGSGSNRMACWKPTGAVGQ